MALVNGQSIAVLDVALDRVDVGDVELGIDAVDEEVHRQGDDVDVAGALAVAEQRALDAVGTRHDTEFRRGDGAPAVVVRMQRQHDGLAVVHRAVEPLDDVAVHLRRVALDGCRQVEDDRTFGCRLDDVHDAVTDLECEIGFGEREALGRVLVAQVGTGQFRFERPAQSGGVDGEVDHLIRVHSEHDAPLQRIHRVVEVHDRRRGTAQRLVGAADELLARLHEHLDGDVVGNVAALDEHPHEIEVGLARRGEPHLDLAESHLYETPEQAQFALRIHRVDECLVAVAQVDGAPRRCAIDRAVRPRAVAEHEGNPSLVFLERHEPRCVRGGFRCDVCRCLC